MVRLFDYEFFYNQPFQKFLIARKSPDDQGSYNLCHTSDSRTD
jgi:hypothetical protein